MISVIIPVYNASRYLAETLDSVLGQDGVDFEVIAVDDGSTDESPAILADYAERDSRLHVITGKNSGVSAARNAGIKVSSGEYLCFVDADDILASSQALYTMASALDSGEVDIVLGGTVASSSPCFKHNPVPATTTTGVDVTPDEVLHQALYQRGPINERGLLNSVWGKLFKRSLFDGLLFNESRRYEDLDLAYRLYHKARCIREVDAEFYIYRVHGESFMQRFTPQRYDVLGVVDDMVEYVSHHCPRHLSGAVDRRFSAYYNMYMLSIKHGYDDRAEKCMSVIKECRLNILRDPSSRLKNRVGALLSYAPWIVKVLSK